MRVFACSDLHVDYRRNLEALRAISQRSYRDDILLLAGDVSDNLELLSETLCILRERFARVFFVPGNHELWDRRGDFAHALERFEAILTLCAALEVDTAPAQLGSGSGALRIVPLFSWYRRPHDGASSLYLPKSGERGAALWADDRHVRWPADMAQPPADYFLSLNEAAIHPCREPVISFSHFLPRRELMFADTAHPPTPPLADPHPGFNFSRVAGCSLLDRQIRRLGAATHVYGHQHRNRDRVIDGVRYVSHCLGYPRERDRGYLNAASMQPACVWPPAPGDGTALPRPARR